MYSLFKNTNDLIRKIDNFIDLTAQSGLHFRQGLKFYSENRFDEFEERLYIIRETENSADAVRKDVEAQLYSRTLIPESRGDVLGILESMDKIINQTKEVTLDFSIERPEVPEKITKGFMELAEPVIKAIESLVFAARAFFYDINAVKDHLHLIKFYEKEADNLAEKIKREIFELDIDLARKMQLVSFTSKIDALADWSEEVSDRIAIATIKRIN